MILRSILAVVPCALGVSTAVLPTETSSAHNNLPAESAASANELEVSSHYDQPVSAGRTPGLASTCVTFGPRWGQLGRYFTAICMSGHGAFYVKARCYDDDWRYRTTVYGTPAAAPYGVSEGWCPFGTHPWTRWIVIL